MQKLPPEKLSEFLKRFNDDEYRQDRSQSMIVKRAGGNSTKIKLFWTFEISDLGSRVFKPGNRVDNVVKELNWRLMLQDKRDAAEFALDDYVIRVSRGQLVFEIKLKRVK